MKCVTGGPLNRVPHDLNYANPTRPFMIYPQCPEGRTGQSFLASWYVVSRFTVCPLTDDRDTRHLFLWSRAGLDVRLCVAYILTTTRKESFA